MRKMVLAASCVLDAGDPLTLLRTAQEMEADLRAAVAGLGLGHKKVVTECLVMDANASFDRKEHIVVSSSISFIGGLA